jgi:hypothetical protein
MGENSGSYLEQLQQDAQYVAENSEDEQLRERAQNILNQFAPAE